MSSDSGYAKSSASNSSDVISSLETGLASVDITPRDERTAVLGIPTANEGVGSQPPSFDLTSASEEAQPSRFLMVSDYPRLARIRRLPHLVYS